MLTKQKDYILVVTALFGVMAFFHLIRALYRWEAIIGGQALPLWMSWVGIAIAGYLSWVGYKLWQKH